MLTDEELAAIKERCDVADIPRLLAEVERLRRVRDAAKARPWWRQWSDVDGETGEFIAENMECHVCGFERRDTDPVQHADSCEMAALDAAIDAAEGGG